MACGTCTNSERRLDAKPIDERRRNAQFRAIWHAIHTCAIKEALSREALLAMLRMLPSTCDCEAKAIVYLDAHPLPPREQFAWSVDFHNAVNVRRGVPTMGVDVARKIYEVPPII